MWQTIVNWISSPAVDGTVIAVTEFAMRAWPTAKPWSWFVPVNAVIVGVIQVLTALQAMVLQPIITAANNTTPAAPQAQQKPK